MGKKFGFSWSWKRASAEPVGKVRRVTMPIVATTAAADPLSPSFPQPLTPSRHPMRTWSDKSGQHAIEARYAGFKPGIVILEKPDGKQIDVDLSMLAEPDRRHAVETARERGDLAIPRRD